MCQIIFTIAFNVDYVVHGNLFNGKILFIENVDYLFFVQEIHTMKYCRN